MQIEEATNIDLTLENERKIWNHLLGTGLILFPKSCPACDHSVTLHNNDTLNNPYLGKCTNSQCRKIFYLRVNTLFDKFPCTPISILCYIIYLCLHHKKNAIEIYKEFKYRNIQYNVSLNHILDILQYMHLIITHYLKDIYLLENIAEENKDESISLDESLFVHDNGVQIWICGLINNQNRKIRLEILEDRIQNTMKKIIERLVPSRNRIVTDQANCYNFLNMINSGYSHSIHSHAHGDFRGTRLNESY